MSEPTKAPPAARVVVTLANSDGRTVEVVDSDEILLATVRIEERDGYLLVDVKPRRNTFAIYADLPTGTVLR